MNGERTFEWWFAISCWMLRAQTSSLWPLEDTTCDRPHLGEDMGSVPTPAANSAEELETAAGLACASRLADYTGQPAVVGFGVQYDFQSSGMTCWLTSTGGEVTGTRRSGLMSR